MQNSALPDGHTKSIQEEPLNSAAESELAARNEPAGMVEVLGAEYQALRPTSDYSAVADTAALFAKVHAESQPLSALCISGGGIRSATFALGALQGLAKHQVLEKFDYLSTVSGGGYIGSWLTAWSNRVGGLKNVIPHLRPDAMPAEQGAPDPIQHLRDYNSYLSPKLGALSSDTWTLVATVVRNLLLNWMVLIPLFMAALMVPRFFLSGLAFPELLFGAIIYDTSPNNCGSTFNYCASVLNDISGSLAIRFGLPLLSAFLFAMALFNILRYLPGVGDEDHTMGDYLSKVLAPLVGAVLAYVAFDSLYYLGSTYTAKGSLLRQILALLVPCALAWIAFLVFPRGAAGGRRLIGPLSFAIFLMAAGAGVAIWTTANYLFPVMTWPEYTTFAPPSIFLGFILGMVLFVGLSSHFLKDEDREWMSRATAGMLMFCGVWILVCGMVLLIPQWTLDWKDWQTNAMAVIGGLSAWASAFGSGFIAKFAIGNKDKPGMMVSVASKIIGAAPTIFIVLLMIGLTLATDVLLTSAHLLPVIGGFPAMNVLTVEGQPVEWLDHYEILKRTSLVLELALFVMLAVLSWVMARYVNINTFSLHGMYRERLVRAYLGASNSKRHANKFTGFARDDNIPMHKLDPQLKPLHVVNLTLNLVESNRLAWQQRKAQPFSVSPLYCGNFDLGYRSSAKYGGTGGISLGTAVAISGAAASPSMGYHSSPVTGFIMTLLNARLGSWLGNPGIAGARTWRHSGPHSAIRSLIKEAFGLTSNLNSYVYLSDGGHFENLGLYEMVLRRCRCIFVLDSGCDPDFSFEDLGNALRKIRIDLGIPISFDEASMQALRKRSTRCAVASIAYSAVDGAANDGGGVKDGWLIYVKPMLLGTESPDVANYGSTHPDFPHESTNNQWFNESQTESYRMLGLTSIEEICRNWDGSSLEELHRHVQEVYRQQ